MANPNCPTCGGSGKKTQVDKVKDANGNEYDWLREVPCGC